MSTSAPRRSSLPLEGPVQTERMINRRLERADHIIFLCWKLGVVDELRAVGRMEVPVSEDRFFTLDKVAAHPGGEPRDTIPHLKVYKYEHAN